jgi:hypothetical protein
MFWGALAWAWLWHFTMSECIGAFVLWYLLLAACPGAEAPRGPLPFPHFGLVTPPARTAHFSISETSTQEHTVLTLAWRTSHIIGTMQNGAEGPPRLFTPCLPYQCKQKETQL